MFSIRLIAFLILIGLTSFCGWLFFWPLIESYYAMSLVPLIGNELKLTSFIIGGIIFWISIILLIKKGMKLII